MIISRITGGLGNQLFQYAMGRRLAIHHGTELLLDAAHYGPQGEQRCAELSVFERPFALSHFRIQARMATPDEVSNLRDDYYRATLRDRSVRLIRRYWPQFLRKESDIVEREFLFQPQALGYPDNVYLRGFWQSPAYFADVASQIRSEFQPLDESTTRSAREKVESLREKYGSIVSLHVRRGDLARAKELGGKEPIAYGVPVSTQYIENAIRQFAPETAFFVFSDSAGDIAWCRQNVRARNLEFSAAESDMWDFAAMRHCDHHIIANSTFSWWAAWLDDKPGRRVVAPRVWSSPSYPVAMPTDDLLPQDWIVL